MTEARFYETIGSTAHCKLCPHGCAIEDGKTGLCNVRRNMGGILYSESYGQLSSLALDPIEKKPLRHFHPGRYILSVGSYGCNMSCPYCQNSSISKSIPHTQLVPPEDLAELAKSYPDNLGIAFTYNEPLVCIEYLLDDAPLIKEAGLKVVLVTNGFVREPPLEALQPYVDAMNIDVKGFSQSYYSKLGGDLETVKRVVETCANACHVEVTSLIVPGKNDSIAEMKKLSDWLASISPDIPLHITRFFPHYKMTDMPPTPIPALYELAETAKQALRHVYIGNV